MCANLFSASALSISNPHTNEKLCQLERIAACVNTFLVDATQLGVNEPMLPVLISIFLSDEPYAL